MGKKRAVVLELGKLGVTCRRETTRRYHNAAMPIAMITTHFWSRQMYRVDKLNRQYEKLRETIEQPESMGPLEASVKTLQKEIAAVRKFVWVNVFSGYESLV